jgi:2'-5' RNA ligase
MVDAKPLRTFIAVEFSTQTRTELGRLTQRLAQAGPERSVTWVKPEAMHLTLKFLGETLPDQLPAIQAALDGVASKQASFTVTTNGLGCFPTMKKPRVIWVGFAKDEVARLGDLNRAVEAAIAPLGFPTEARPFSPHLTLGRVRKEASPAVAARVGEAVGAVKDVPRLADSIQAILFIKSELKPSGPEYTVLYHTGLTG